LAALKPAALVFAKLDVWPELTLAAARRGVKLGLIAATVAPHSSRRGWPARQWATAAYRALDRIGTISEEDGRRLRALGARSEAIQVTGDTRYDSVVERAERFDRTREPFLRLGAVRADAFTIVAGSTWPGDEAVVLPAFADLLAQVPAARLILAPHEPHPDHLAGIAFVGPHWHMSRDAALLIERGGAVALPADGRRPLHAQWLVWHHDDAARGKAGKAGKKMVLAGRGAAERTTALVLELVAG